MHSSGIYIFEILGNLAGLTQIIFLFSGENAPPLEQMALHVDNNKLLALLNF